MAKRQRPEERRAAHRRAYPSVRVLVWHQSAERFGQAYGAAAQAEFEALRALRVPWAVSTVHRYWSSRLQGAHYLLQVLIPCKPYQPCRTAQRFAPYVPGPFPCWQVA